ncbi:electron transfer flavoprotein subunit alpha/FixB family protein [Agrilactobacillus yilanensis]|uniref:Electron transfer flavoprotein subunit alpha/FixB family protein n=1 Tax=Agrilactobacillus yilanensis TaxID=2485997 RepID=A0ABW4J6F6_9LACO|nr:electron transfer flavoprotein subunit alpha/FixB family protein [Agrilactobacillus yilanensis]
MNNQTVYLCATTDDQSEVEALQKVVQESFSTASITVVAFQSEALDQTKFQASFDQNVDAITFLNVEKLSVLDPNAVAKAYNQYFQKNDAGRIIFYANRFNNGIAARVAASNLSAIVTDVEKIEATDDHLNLVKKSYSGALKRQITVTDAAPLIITVNNSNITLEKVAAKETAVTEETLSIDYQVPKTAVYKSLVDNDNLNLDNAEVVVAGGRGLKGAEEFKNLEKLAENLSAAVGASRPVVDNGWVPNTLMVGQSGKSIEPDIYFAFGISGAVQHTVGIENVKTIVAINSDEKAPIFKIADYGIVGDAKEVIEKMTEITAQK